MTGHQGEMCGNIHATSSIETLHSPCLLCLTRRKSLICLQFSIKSHVILPTLLSYVGKKYVLAHGLLLEATSEIVRACR